jgi:hypothetical protein
MFWGNAGASIASIVAFWLIFYVWIGAEMWLGSRRRRLPVGATGRDSGTKVWLISSIWASVAIGIGLAYAFPEAGSGTGGQLSSSPAWS